MAPLVILAPGASGTAAGLRGHVEALGSRGVAAHAIDLPRGSADRALPVWRAAVEKESAESLVIGGHSFGGRVASLLAADWPFARPLAGLLLLSYPLHRPGHPEAWRERTDHWPRIACPVLLLSGESDPFARIALLREAVRRLPAAQLHTYPGVRHGIGPVLADAIGRVAAWVDRLPPER